MTDLLEILVEMRRIHKSAQYILDFWAKAQSQKDGVPLKRDRARALSALCRELRHPLGELLDNLTAIEDRAEKIAASQAPDTRTNQT